MERNNMNTLQCSQHMLSNIVSTMYDYHAAAAAAAARKNVVTTTWSMHIFIFIIGIGLLRYLYRWFVDRGLPPRVSGVSSSFGDTGPGHFDAQYLEWSKTYGPIFQVDVSFFEAWFVVTGYDLIKDVLHTRGEMFSYRPNTIVTKVSRLGRELPFGRGIVNASGERWKEQKQFALTFFRNTEFSLRTAQDIIAEEVDKLLECIDACIEEDDSVIDMEAMIKVCIMHIISRLLFAKAYKKSDKEFLEMKDAHEKIMLLSRGAGIGLLAMFPWLTSVDWLERVLGVSDFSKANKHLESCFQQAIEKVKVHSNADATQKPTCFVDAYLKHMQQRKEDTEDSSYFSDEQLLAGISDLWSSSVEPLSHTCRWALFFMMQQQDVQEKCLEEINAAMDANKRPTFEDRSKLTYVHATLNEVLRFCSVFDATAFRTCVEETQLGGYRIPAGSTLVLFISTIHMNDRYFPNPRQFDPTRFLNASGELIKLDHFIPFGNGKRVCVGEHLAQMMLFHVFTALVQRYTFAYPPAERMASQNKQQKGLQCMVEKRTFTS